VPPTVHQQAYKSTTLLGITQESPKRLKDAFHNAQATSQWKKGWTMDSSFLLHIQHLSTTTKYRFLNLFTVRVFPKATDQEKKNTLK